MSKRSMSQCIQGDKAFYESKRSMSQIVQGVKRSMSHCVQGGVKTLYESMHSMSKNVLRVSAYKDS